MGSRLALTPLLCLALWFATVGWTSAQPVAAGVLPKTAETFEIGGRKAYVWAAQETAEGRPWVWYAPTLGGVSLVQRKMYFEEFMKAGIGIAGFDLRGAARGGNGD